MKGTLRVALDAAIYLARNKESPSGFEFNSYFDIWHATAHRRRDGTLRAGHLIQTFGSRCQC